MMEEQKEVNRGSETAKVEVSDSKKVSSGIRGHTAYSMKGQDNDGEFEVVRRYKEFLVFRDALTKRYPGFYVPPIPPKVVKKNNKKVIEERQYLLNRFMERLAEDPYLWGSEEVRLFTRPSQNIKQ